MAKGNFAACNAVTRVYEGGYANHPSDPGGKTMNGITEAVFHSWLKSKGQKTRAVRTITEAETDAIYKELYWNKAGCEGLAAGVDLAVYDAAVNSGVSRGRKWLLSSVGGPHDATVKKICATRMSFVRGLSTFKVFGKGWTRRISGIEAKGVAWALIAMDLSVVEVKESLKIESERSKVASSTQAGAAVGSTTTSAAAAGTAVSPTDVADAFAADPNFAAAVAALLAAISAVSAAYTAYKAKINNDRADAYRIEAGL